MSRNLLRQAIVFFSFIIFKYVDQSKLSMVSTMNCFVPYVHIDCYFPFHHVFIRIIELIWWISFLMVHAKAGRLSSFYPLVVPPWIYKNFVDKRWRYNWVLYMWGGNQFARDRKFCMLHVLFPWGNREMITRRKISDTNTTPPYSYFTVHLLQKKKFLLSQTTTPSASKKKQYNLSLSSANNLLSIFFMTFICNSV